MRADGIEAQLRDVEQALREARSPDVRELLRGIRDSLRARANGNGQDLVVEIVSAARRTPAELAELFTAGYEDYFLPVQIDEAAFATMAASWDYDLDASRVATEGGTPVGLALLGRRRGDGWVGGVGVVAGRRGAGIGRRLMDALAAEARRLGVQRLWLEVLAQNEPAIRLYERLGYRRTRELEVWSLSGSFVLRRGKGGAADVEEVRGRIVRERTQREPWQRADETVARHDDVQAHQTDGAALLYRVAGGRVSLLQGVADDEGAAREALRSLPVEVTALSFLNGPAGDPFCRAIDSLGGTLSARQHEMLLEL